MCKRNLSQANPCYHGIKNFEILADNLPYLGFCSTYVPHFFSKKTDVLAGSANQNGVIQSFQIVVAMVTKIMKNNSTQNYHLPYISHILPHSKWFSGWPIGAGLRHI